MSKEIEDEIYLMVFGLLNGGSKIPSKDEIKKFIVMQLDIKKMASETTGEVFSIDEIKVEKMVEKMADHLSVETEAHSIIDFRDTQHVEWLDRRRIDIENGLHWTTYKKYLSRQLSQSILTELDQSTDKILSNIEDPERNGIWSSRGLVIGDVQSGKTTNFIGVINKSLDAGYKVIIVLSGLHNNLRTQTQQRFEEGVTGSNTKTDALSNFCGVAKYIDDPSKLRIEGITSRNDTGDFTRVKEPNSTFSKIFSINKKNVNTLTRLIKYIKGFIPEGQNSHRNLPLLLIDDEADNASINTKKPDFDPSTINRLITELLSLFDKNSYIGYTATPFANVLSDVKNTQDLFPRNFIMCLGRADNYIGPAQVFGEIEDQETSNEDIVDLNKRKTNVDWFRNIDNPHSYDSDWIEFLPNRHNKETILGEMPDSLKDAIYSFLIGIKIRSLRGDEYEHKTMLIHITRFQNVQRQIVEMVDDFVNEIYSELAIGQINKIDNSHLEAIENVYYRDFENTGFSWETIEENLSETVSLLKDHIFGINGDIKDVIDEEKYEKGLVSIRIGGDKLSRGLTLPGLMVSYFLRTSRMYDTLMQMGRWFGYRDGYEDLCRIFTTGRLYNWYGHISFASEGLRRRIQQMNLRYLSPLEYRQEVQSHPGMMLVTALNKQYHSRKLSISYNNSNPQIYSFDLSLKGIEIQKENLNHVNNFFETLSTKKDSEVIKLNTIFRDVSADDVKNFIRSFHYGDNVIGIWDTKSIVNYISEMNKIEELTSWTVVLFSNSSSGPEKDINVANFKSRPLMRKNRMSDNIISISRANIMNELSERLDFTEEEVNQIRQNIQKPKREDFRNARPKERALLVIYLLDANSEEAKKDMVIPTCAISFPNSINAKTTEFTVNSVEGNEDLEEED